MQLARKKENNFNNNSTTGSEKGWTKGEPINFRLYDIDYDGIVPYGKHANKTLRYVKNYDEHYYTWMISNCILSSWGLLKLKPKKLQVPDDYSDQDSLVSSTGNRWLFIYEVEKKGSVSPFL